MLRVIKAAQDIYGMARIGEIKQSGTVYEIYVNTNDGGMIPHFHFRDKNNWDEFHTCIEIARPVYFHHNGKEDVLNSKQKRELDNFMRSKITISRYADKFDNNWELVCFLWDLNNSDIVIGGEIQQPDYTKLP